jgi:hypothetical protein
VTRGRWVRRAPRRASGLRELRGTAPARWLRARRGRPAVPGAGRRTARHRARGGREVAVDDGEQRPRTRPSTSAQVEVDAADVGELVGGDDREPDRRDRTEPDAGSGRRRPRPRARGHGGHRRPESPHLAGHSRGVANLAAAAAAGAGLPAVTGAAAAAGRPANYRRHTCIRLPHPGAPLRTAPPPSPCQSRTPDIADLAERRPSRPRSRAALRWLCRHGLPRPPGCRNFTGCSVEEDQSTVPVLGIDVAAMSPRIQSDRDVALEHSRH